MGPYQRRACRRAFLAGTLCAAMLLGLVLLNTRSVTATSYSMTVTAVSQAPTRARAEAESTAPARFIDKILTKRRHPIPYYREADTRPALGRDGKVTDTLLFVQSYTLRSQDEAALSKIAKEIERSSPWRVANISEGGEFVRATNRNVRIWRIRSAMRIPGKKTQTWLQISGPSASLGYADYIAFAFIAILIMSFGSLERSRSDPSAFPPGLHPIVIWSQLMLASLLVCWTWTYTHIPGTGTSAAFIAMCVLAMVSLAMWALRTKEHWAALCF